MVPVDRFTPHGYLHNPHHTRNLSPSGVVRSVRGIGFAWHYPALPQGYGFRRVYEAGMRLYLVEEERVRLELEDFPDLHARRHTMNELTYAWEGAGLRLEAAFFLVGEHAIACRASLVSDGPRRIGVGLALSYARELGAVGGWGESGLVGAVHAEHLVLQGFEDGEAFAASLTVDVTPIGVGAAASGDAAGMTHDLAAVREIAAAATLDDLLLRAPRMDADHAVVIGERGDTVRLHGALLRTLDLEPGASVQAEALLARGIRRDLAIGAARAARTAAPVALAGHRADDEAFWRCAPLLEGDWPDVYRRGLVIDLETLRMMVRDPIGIYRHPWDAMQIQAPRVVLAEAAIDALLLSYADLAAAKSLLLGTFLDAPAPNVPCSREDGSYTMVGANGSECGTAPEWGYPVRVAAHLFERDGDLAWLEALLPPLERYLLWWETERSDDEGYVVYENSWESGQDLSARFGEQRDGGGSTIRTLRPVDLQAAMADACGHLARFAARLGRDPAPWQARADRHLARTRALWHDGDFRDHDESVGWSDVWDVMQLAPVALGLATEEQLAALRERIAGLDQDPYLWPMFVWTAVDAAQRAGLHGTAATIAAATLDRAYGAWDRRSPGPDDPLPGVACEFWGTDGSYGAEGYGWGAFGVHLLFRTLLGYQTESAGAFLLRPNLPEAWSDGRYAVRALPAGPGVIDLAVERRAGAYLVTLVAREGLLQVGDEVGRSLRVAVRDGEEIRVRILGEQS